MKRSDKEVMDAYGNDPFRLRVHMEKLEETLRLCADRRQELADPGETRKRRQLLAIERRVRLMLERLKTLP